MSESKPSPEKLIEKYKEGMEKLSTALFNLSDSDLDRTRDQGKWTIRQIVHHIVDAEYIWAICTKALLGNPGCTFDLSWYIPDNKCAEPLDYAHRPIDDAVELFLATRRHIIELLNHFPDAWQKELTFKTNNIPDGKIFTLEDIIHWQSEHLQIHLKQIDETRQKQGV